MDFYIPNSHRLSISEVEIYVLDDFLNQTECLHLVKLITANLRPSQLTYRNEFDNEFRTNESCDIDDLHSPIAKDIDNRMSRLLDFDPNSSEFMQGQLYSVGQEFKPHHDYFSQDELKTHSRGLGQRTYTFMVYLNDVEEGGETAFPALGLKFSPRQGRALIWNNLLPDGRPNEASLHQGLPVAAGKKCIVTKWFRSNELPPKQLDSPGKRIKAFTRLGIKKSVVPSSIFHEIAAYYHSNILNAAPEAGSEHLVICETKEHCASDILQIGEVLSHRIQESLVPFAEEWAQAPLIPTYVYGIRIYRRGAFLLPHVDRAATHTIGILINIDQDVEEDWPLTIEDNSCRDYDVILRPGEMLLYEGTRLQHGRSRPLHGSRYANLFCHFIPRP